MVSLMHRDCRVCEESKDLYKDFYKARANKDGPSAYAYECKECTKARIREDYKRDPAPTRNRHLKRRYNIDLNDYNVLLEQQGSVCATCGTSEPGGRWGMFAVDHCHTTGKVRGLLCKRCNIALGEVGDNISTLQKMIEYLQKL